MKYFPEFNVFFLGCVNDDFHSEDRCDGMNPCTPCRVFERERALEKEISRANARWALVKTRLLGHS